VDRRHLALGAGDPGLHEIRDGPKTFQKLYSNLADANPMWTKVPSVSGQVYTWPKSTYIAEPPFFEDFSMQPRPAGTLRGARVLGIFGDSLTTDHISPAGSIKPTSPAGIYLQEHDVAVPDFNSFGARRGQSRDHDARHLRQRAHQEPDAFR